MKKILYISLLLMLGLLAQQLQAHPNPATTGDGDEFVEKVSKRLAELKAYNEANIARGEAHKNVYVLDVNRLDEDIEKKFVYDLWETDSDDQHPFYISGKTKEEINEYLVEIEESVQCYLLIGSYVFVSDVGDADQYAKRKEEALKEIYQKSEIGDSENKGAIIDAGFFLLNNLQQVEIFQHYSVVVGAYYSAYNHSLDNFKLSNSDNVNQDLKENVVSIVSDLLDKKIENISDFDEIEEIINFTNTATEVASKYTSTTACNICVRAALYLIKNDPVLFPSSGSGFHDPNDNFLIREIKGYISPDGRAHFIKADFDNLVNKPELQERFTEVLKLEKESWSDYFQRLQDAADKGDIIIGSMLSSSGTTGHVMMVTPGGLVEIEESERTWGKSFVSRGIEKVPRVLECGGKIRENEAPLCRNVDRKGAQERLKWYKYILK